MYLSDLKLWNFRKYGINGDSFENADPGLSVTFNDGVNVLVGENDSGKTAIIDAIRYVLRTQSLEYIQLEDKDFHKPQNSKEEARASELKIECTFKGFSEDGADAAHFLEWLGFDEKNENILKVWLYAKRKDNFIIQNVRAGIDNEGSYIEGDARELLRVIYLKPLRDALSEMTHGNKSRLAQILKSLDVFKKRKIEGKDEKHDLENKYEALKEDVDDYFKTGSGKEIQKTINDLLTDDFFLGNEERKAGISLTGSDLSDILKQLDLILEENKSGLGSLNLLCIAAELLLLFERKVGLKLTLIEELEAHLHPQYQLRLIDFIQRKKDDYGQFILTTHSTTLASKIDIENLIICNKFGQAFPMGHKFSKLESGDYAFLHRFLDATKANLFFAKGVILVEGDAENLLLPTIAEIIDKPLHKFGVSMVNIGNTAFLRYSRIFLRNTEPFIDIPVSLITDLDIKPLEYYVENVEEISVYEVNDVNLDSLKKIEAQIEYENLKNFVFTSPSAFNSAVNSNKSIKISISQRDEILNICKKEIDTSNIEELKKNAKQSKEIKYNEQNVKVYIATNWTLEYEIALSCLKEELYEAILRADFQMKNNDLELSIEDKTSIKEIVKEYFESKNSFTQQQIAFDIYYNTLLKNNISKAITAQNLSEILFENGFKMYYSLIKEDVYLKYLVDAIDNVTSRKSVSESKMEEDGNGQ